MFFSKTHRVDPWRTRIVKNWQAPCLCIGLSALLISFILTSVTQAQQLVLEETYDNLPLGSVVPNWKAVEPGKDATLPVVQNVSFKSAPYGMKIANDFYVLRSFNPLEGTVSIELWWNPKKGSDTNSFLRLEVEGVGSVVIVGKNETDMWRYTKAGVQTPFKPVDGQGHSIKIVYKTSTGTYDLFFDGGLENSNVPLAPGVVENNRITGISLSSGHGGSRTTSYFDDLRVFSGGPDGGGEKPDLVVASVDAPSTGKIGQNIDVTVQTKNQGKSKNSGGFKVEIRLSTNQTISTSDKLLFEYTETAQLSPGIGVGVTQSVTIPPNTSMGSYYVSNYKLIS